MGTAIDFAGYNIRVSAASTVLNSNPATYPAQQKDITGSLVDIRFVLGNIDDDGFEQSATFSYSRIDPFEAVKDFRKALVAIDVGTERVFAGTIVDQTETKGSVTFTAEGFTTTVNETPAIGSRRVTDTVTKAGGSGIPYNQEALCTFNEEGKKDVQNFNGSIINDNNLDSAIADPPFRADTFDVSNHQLRLLDDLIETAAPDSRGNAHDMLNWSQIGSALSILETNTADDDQSLNTGVIDFIRKAAGESGSFVRFSPKQTVFSASPFLSAISSEAVIDDLYKVADQKNISWNNRAVASLLSTYPEIPFNYNFTRDNKSVSKVYSFTGKEYVHTMLVLDVDIAKDYLTAVDNDNGTRSLIFEYDGKGGDIFETGKTFLELFGKTKANTITRVFPRIQNMGDIENADVSDEAHEVPIQFVDDWEFYIKFATTVFDSGYVNNTNHVLIGSEAFRDGITNSTEGFLHVVEDLNFEVSRSGLKITISGFNKESTSAKLSTDEFLAKVLEIKIPVTVETDSASQFEATRATGTTLSTIFNPANVTFFSTGFFDIDPMAHDHRLYIQPDVRPIRESDAFTSYDPAGVLTHLNNDDHITHEDEMKDRTLNILKEEAINDDTSYSMTIPVELFFHAELATGFPRQIGEWTSGITGVNEQESISFPRPLALVNRSMNLTNVTLEFK
jgi:hypothetical protein